MRRAGAIVAILVGAFWCAGASAESLMQPAMTRWRSMTSDAPNALYVFLQSRDSSATYQQVIGALGTEGAASLAEMRDAAKRLGASVRAVHLSPQLLDQVPLPAIVSLSTDRSDGCGFAVVASRQGDAYLVIDAGQALWNRMGADEFRRRWTGHALVWHDHSIPGLLRSCLVGAMAGAYVLVWGVRIRQVCQRILKK